MLEQLDETSVRAVLIATNESRKAGHNFVGTEQLLLGVIAVPGMAAQTMAAFGVYVKNLRSVVKSIVGYGSGYVSKEIPFTPRAERVLQIGLEQAGLQDCDSIRPEHLLWALLSDDEGVAIRILEEFFDVEPDHLRSVLTDVMAGMPVPEPAETFIPYIDFDKQPERASTWEGAIWNLSTTDSFFRGDSVSQQMLDWLDQKESLIGVYMNADDNYLVLLQQGIHCFDGDAKTYIGFDTIESVELPATEDDRYLKLILRSKSNAYMLPVWHDTEEVPDLILLYDLIHFALQTPAAAAVDLRDISSKADLIRYIRQPSVTSEGLSELAAWLEGGAPDSSWLAALKIDPIVWQDSDALKLMALIFTRFPNCGQRR